MSSNIKITKFCEFCCAKFIAQKTTTKFCSHKCAQRAYKLKKREAKINAVNERVATENYFSSKKAQKSSSKNKLSEIHLPNIYQRDFLTLREATLLLGICKSTVHRLCVDNRLKCIKMNKKIIIRRRDIDLMFELAPPYQVTPRPKQNCTKQARLEASAIDFNSEDLYSAREAAEKYGYSTSAIHQLAKRKSLRITIISGTYRYFKGDIDRELARKFPDESITEWISVAGTMENYSISKNAVYSLVCEHNVPRKNNQGKILYSKNHIDKIIRCRHGDPTITEWYSMEDIQMKYTMRPAAVANFVFRNNIPKKKLGTRSLYSKDDFDMAIQKKQPSIVYITIQDAMKQYGLSRDSLYGLIHRNGIPKIKDGRFIKIQQLALEQIINPKTLRNYGNS